MQRRSFIGGILAGLAALCGVKPEPWTVRVEQVQVTDPMVKLMHELAAARERQRWIDVSDDYLKYYEVGPVKSGTFLG